MYTGTDPYNVNKWGRTNNEKDNQQGVDFEDLELTIGDIDWVNEVEGDKA